MRVSRSPVVFLGLGAGGDLTSGGSRLHAQNHRHPHSGTALRPTSSWLPFDLQQDV
jgi:hypothetical protein